MITDNSASKYNNIKFEYFSTSQMKFIDFDDMDGEYMKNVVRKVIREDLRLPVRMTKYSDEGLPLVGDLTCLTIES